MNDFKPLELTKEERQKIFDRAYHKVQKYLTEEEITILLSDHIQMGMDSVKECPNPKFKNPRITIFYILNAYHFDNLIEYLKPRACDTYALARIIIEISDVNFNSAVKRIDEWKSWIDSINDGFYFLPKKFTIETLQMIRKQSSLQGYNKTYDALGSIIQKIQ